MPHHRPFVTPQNVDHSGGGMRSEVDSSPCARMRMGGASGSCSGSGATLRAVGGCCCCGACCLPACLPGRGLLRGGPLKPLPPLAPLLPLALRLLPSGPPPAAQIVDGLLAPVPEGAIKPARWVGRRHGLAAAAATGKGRPFNAVIDSRDPQRTGDCSKGEEQRSRRNRARRAQAVSTSTTSFGAA